LMRREGSTSSLQVCNRPGSCNTGKLRGG
jgi:hypothetical protein